MGFSENNGEKALARKGMTVMSKMSLFAAAAVLASVFGASCRPDVVDHVHDSCAPTGEPVNFGFYAFFEPVSYSQDPDPGSEGFGRHLGYEADLLTALEEMEERRLALVRQPIAEWPGTWLLPATPAFDIVGGGITILESRTLDAAGRRAIAFTSGHIAFRQSLLVRSEDAERFASYDSLTREARVGVLRATTGEARLLQIAGIADGEGVLARGTRIETPEGTVVADGTAGYTITAASASAELENRTHLFPPSDAMPQVVYLGDVSGEVELLDALGNGTLDAVARGEVGNGEAARESGDRFVVTAVDSLAEYGGFALDARDTEMLACLDEKLDWLTDERRIGYPEWRADPGVFLARAALWNRE